MTRGVGLIVFAAFLLAQGHTIVVRRSATPATADLLEETFEGVGYAETGWTESNNPDEDETATCPSGTGFSTDCFQADNGATATLSTWDLGSTATTSYFTIYFSFSGTFSDGQDENIFSVDNQSNRLSISAFTATAIAHLTYDAAGDDQAPTCGGPCWRLYTRIGGASSSTTPSLAESTIHKLQFKVVSGSSVGEVKLNGTTIGSGQDSNAGGHGAWQYVFIGLIDNPPTTMNIRIDNVKISSTGYVD